MADPKFAVTDCPVHELISKRYSPYGFEEKSVAESDLCSLFEAARWAASSFNEQPWRYILARREQVDEFSKLLSCLTEGNQSWAKSAGALALGVVSLRFARNEKPNRYAVHDLGLASAQLTLEATARGLSIHQMAGILPEKARDLYDIPDGFEAMTALAIGYRSDSNSFDSQFAERDAAPRKRRPLSETLFESSWGKAADFVR
jgi:nitroreductase